MRVILICVCLVVGALSAGYSQCPTSAFTLPAAACRNESVQITNQSTGASTSQWDFCSGDLTLTPTVSFPANNNLLFRTRSLRIIKNNTKWYGFSIDQAFNKLIRFDFGTSLANNPAVIDLGNPDVALNGAFDFQMYQEGGAWYALVANSGANSLLKISFGADPESTPTTQNLGSFGVLNSPSSMFLVNDNGSLSAFVSQGVGSEIVRFDFLASINNLPAVTSLAITGGSSLRGISIVKECNKWFGLVTSYDNGNVIWLDFNNGLLQPPLSGTISFFTGYYFPAAMSIVTDGGEYFAFIQSAIGSVYRLSFGASIADKTGTGQDMGDFGVSSENFATEWVSDNSTWYGFSIDMTNRRLARFSFPITCNVSLQTYTGATPPAITYSTAGTYKVTVKNTAPDGSVSMLSKTVTVSSSVAPDIDFTSANNCVNNAVNFTSLNSSGGIITYNWDFGDATISHAINPAKTYATAGTYLTQLQVVASNSCTNIVRKNIPIYNQPSADFTLPAASPFCTNQNYHFVNTTTSDVGSNPTWEWRLNGALVSSAQDLTTTFSSTASQQIKLKALIPGCSNEVTKNVATVLTGPVVDFTGTLGCQATPLQFTNTTAGSGLTFSWDFGDSHTSSQTNPTNTYSSFGPFTTTLTATAPNGCQNSNSKSVTIHSVPQTNFNLDLPPFSCSGSPSQFNDATPNPTDSNLSSWTWAFGDAANGTSSQRDPLYTYTLAGPYSVSLKVGTNFGCEATLVKPIIITQSPVAAFAHTIACEDQGTQFTDQSTGSIKSWNWKIGAATYTFNNPIHVFGVPGDFTAQLTVTENNNCIAQVTQNISVPVGQQADFTSAGTCATKSAVFTDQTPASTDPITSVAWNFAGQGAATGETANFIFPTTGNFPVTMNAHAASGCVYSVTKTVPIVAPPHSSFTTSVDDGPLPLHVDFTNTSTLATSYLWRFHDQANSESEEVSPSFVFEALGDYVVDLDAGNALGCVDTYSKVIHAVVPQADAAITGIQFVPDGAGGYQAVYVLVNEGNLPLINPGIEVEMEGSASLRENLVVTVQPGAQTSLVLRYSLLPGDLQYVCIKVNAASDVDEHNDKACASFGQQTIVLAPYPNPVSGFLHLDWITKEAATASITVFNSTGGLVVASTLDAAEPGLNQVQLDVSDLSPGVYSLQLKYGATRKSFRFAVQ